MEINMNKEAENIATTDWFNNIGNQYKQYIHTMKQMIIYEGIQ